MPVNIGVLISTYFHTKRKFAITNTYPLYDMVERAIGVTGAYWDFLYMLLFLKADNPYET